MTAQNLWGILGETELGRTPTVVLREQAGLLGQLTNELLEGRVIRRRRLAVAGIRASLYIVAPAIARYRVKILELNHGLMNIYPVQVLDSIGESEVSVEDEEGLMEALGSILSSEEVKRIISILMSESTMTE